MLEHFAERAWAVLLDASLKSLLLLAVAGLALLCLRRASAAGRHLALLLTLACLLLLPLLSSTLPGWHIRWPRTAAVLPPVPQMGTPAPGTPLPPALPLGTQAASPADVPASALTAPDAPKPASLPWSLLVCAFWLVGVCAVLAPVLAGLVCVDRLGRRSLPVTTAMAGVGAELAPRLGIRRAVAFRQTGDTGASPVPMTWGWRRPVVLLPATAGDWSAERLRVVLLHELAHIQRGDWLWQMLAHAVCALYWFHPGVWLVARGLRLESERACDDQVLAAGIAAPDYATHLVEVARTLSQTKASPSVALPMAGRSQIESRVRAILVAQRREASMTRRVFALIACATGLLALAVAMLHPVAEAQEAPPASSAGQRPNTQAEAVAHLKRVYHLIAVYRQRHGGAYPVDEIYLQRDVASNRAAYGFQTADAAHSVFTTWQKPSTLQRTSSMRLTNVLIVDRRPDGQLIGGPKPVAARDILAKSVDHEAGPGGYTLLLWDDGRVEKIPTTNEIVFPAKIVSTPGSRPHPQALSMTKAQLINAWKSGQTLILAAGYPGEAGLPAAVLTSQQFAALQPARAKALRRQYALNHPDGGIIREPAGAR